VSERRRVVLIVTGIYRQTHFVGLPICNVQFIDIFIGVMYNHDLTLWWTRVQRLIIYRDLCNHPIIVHYNLSKDQKPGLVCIRFFIYDWTLTSITSIYSHRIHNHIPIRITIVIYNFMEVARTRSWPNHHFYYSIVRNIWFSVCIPT
jgi:hypothetical protein